MTDETTPSDKNLSNVLFCYFKNCASTRSISIIFNNYKFDPQLILCRSNWNYYDYNLNNLHIFKQSSQVLKHPYFSNCDIASRYECIYRKIGADTKAIIYCQI